MIVALAAAEAMGAERYDSDPASNHLTVEGTSTVHHWAVRGHMIQGYVIFHEGEPSGLWATSDSVPRRLTPAVHVEIPVASLKSGTRGMDKKMSVALKAQSHPMITYQLESAEVTSRQTAQENSSQGPLTIETQGTLTVAGMERPVRIPMQIRRLSKDRLEVSGKTSLRMTDFGIDPPTAMLGVLRTDDTVQVHWTWVLVLSQTDTRDKPSP